MCRCTQVLRGPFLINSILLFIAYILLPWPPLFLIWIIYRVMQKQTHSWDWHQDNKLDAVLKKIRSILLLLHFEFGWSIEFNKLRGVSMVIHTRTHIMRQHSAALLHEHCTWQFILKNYICVCHPVSPRNSSYIYMLSAVFCDVTFFPQE